MYYRLRKIKEYDKSFVRKIQAEQGVGRVPAILLFQRSFGADDELKNPCLFSDMKKAVERIDVALIKNEKITVYGDYDADGVTATALLYLYLKDCGANVDYYIPERISEGYGLNTDAVRKIHNNSTDLIITVDNGINSVESAELIAELGMDLIITDHHLGGENEPQAVAILNCNTNGYEGDFHGFAGVGVAFKLICAHHGNTDEMLEKYADIVAVGTIGDVMPILSENRTIVKKGLEKLNTYPCVGLTALIEQSGIGKNIITSNSVAFGIVPRINAAGRMDSALTALELLISDDEYEAQKLAKKVCDINIKRQETESEITAFAEKKLLTDGVEIYDKIIVVDGDNWHEGVIGIVAAKILHKFGKPAIVISKDGETAKGSGRSIDEFSLHNALSEVSQYFIGFGGHDKAAGLTIPTENIEAFKQALRENLAQTDLPHNILTVDALIDISEINMELCEFLSELEPFGTDNEVPVFALDNLRLESISPVGNGNHLRLTFSKGTVKIQAMYFGMSITDFDYSIGETLNIAVTVGKNEYMGRIKPSLTVKDVMSPNIDYSLVAKYERLFEAFKSGEKISRDEAEKLTPNRKILEAVYKFIRDKNRFNPVAICNILNSDGDIFAAVLVAADVFLEMGLIEYSESNNLVVTNSPKVDINNSEVLKKLREV